MLHYSRWYATLVILLSLAALALGGVNLLPRSVAEQLPIRMPRFVLGLDLQGGAHLLFHVDVDRLRADRMNAIRDDVRRAILDQPRINIV